MTEIVTEHRGYSIRYAENEDVWRCYDLELDAKTLGALRAKVDKLDADARRVDNVRAYKLPHAADRGVRLNTVVVTLIEAGEYPVGHSRHGKLRVFVTHVDPDTGEMKPPGRRVREKLDADDLAPMTDAARAAIADWQAAEAALSKARDAAKAAHAAIPRLTGADLGIKEAAR